MKFRGDTQLEFTAVSAICEWFGRWLARVLHLGNDSNHQFPDALERVNLTGREP